VSQSTDVLALLQQAHKNVDFHITGEGCRFQVRAIGVQFDTLTPLERQRTLNKTLKPLIDDGTIHAVQYKIYTPAEWAQQQEQQRG
jgi:acid stress-induced BolA-like protein IbaG/YrbA